LRSVLDTAELEAKGIPTVVLVEPGWYKEARFIAHGVKLSERRIQVLPLGTTTASSIDAIPIVEQHIADILDGIIKGFGDADPPRVGSASGSD